MLKLNLQLFGGRGASSGAGGGISASSIQKRLSKGIADLESDFKIVQSEYSQSAKALNYTNSKLARDNFDKWSDRRRNLQNELMYAREQKSKFEQIRKNVENSDTVSNVKWSQNKNGDIELSYDLDLPNNNGRLKTGGANISSKTTATINKQGEVSYSYTRSLP